MKKKLTFYTEAAYFVGIIAIALGVGFSERADFGLSMVVAPAYVLHRFISTLPGMGFFSFGVAEYTLQAVLIVVLSIVVKKFRLSYLFSFVTAVFYGYILDLILALMPTVAADAVVLRVVFFLLGQLFCTIGVSMVFRTYIPPEAYELFVAQASAHFGMKTERFKTCYDLVSCTLGVILSFAFFGFGSFVGISWGTLFCALTNGFIIGWLSKLWDRIFYFKDGWKLRKYFEK